MSDSEWNTKSTMILTRFATGYSTSLTTPNFTGNKKKGKTMSTEREQKEIDEELRNFLEYLERKATITPKYSKEDVIRGLKIFCKKATYTTEDIRNSISELNTENKVYVNARIKYLLTIIEQISNFVKMVEKCH